LDKTSGEQGKFVDSFKKFIEMEVEVVEEQLKTNGSFKG